MDIEGTVKAIFDQYDPEKTGQIDHNHSVQFIVDLFVGFGVDKSAVSEEAIKGALKEITGDDSDHITHEELTKFLKDWETSYNSS